MRTSVGAAPWLSVILPTHRGERWLGDTLDSLAAQCETGFECIVIDSSPDEGTMRLVQSYADRLSFRTFKRPDLEHWRSKTNFGFEVARAQHVCMLHQDDFWRPERSTIVRQWIAAAPEVSVHLHPALVVDEHGRRLGTWRCPLPADGRPIDRSLLVERLLVQNFISVPTPVIRRDAFLAVGGIDEALWYTGDWDLYLKLALAGTVAYHPQALSCFRIHGASLTMSGSRDAADFERQLREVLDKHIAQLPAARRAAVTPRALASLRVNLSLAAANAGAPAHLAHAAAAIAGLGPVGAYQYLRDSRLAERVIPRLRARLAGGL